MIIELYKEFVELLGEVDDYFHEHPEQHGDLSHNFYLMLENLHERVSMLEGSPDEPRPEASPRVLP
jgi:hypothetical protein